MRQLGKISFGPGGLVSSAHGENEELLEQIEKAPVLPPSDLLKLAEFYGAYPTNAQLGNHLSLVALTKLLSNRDVHEQLQETLKQTTLAAGKAVNNHLDATSAIEDLFDGYDDEGSKDKLDLPWARVEIKYVLDSGVGLLIETPGTKDSHKKRHYVIGASPDPDSL